MSDHSRDSVFPIRSGHVLSVLEADDRAACCGRRHDDDVRKRHFMTPEVMKKFRCGYLPNNAKGLLRGHFVYGYPDTDGNILTWFGRNLNYEDQHKKWQRSGDSSKEPHKFKFVKGFHRGQELYGESQFHELATPEQIGQTGIILVEGPNDVINLHNLGVPAIAVCSNTISETQADKLATLANSIPGGHVSVMFDLDREGENGAKQTVLELAKRCCVRLAWTTNIAEGIFREKQPESISDEASIGLSALCCATECAHRRYVVSASCELY